jgi:light-regulated signal transduction histidine kinase (bacteriophytochrome)
VIDYRPSVRKKNGILGVFQNLVGNAINDRSSEEPHISHLGTVGRDEWILCVPDNGIGFDMSYAKRIFKPFRRLHSTAQIQGTGIGLAIVKRMVERHGGRLWAKSELAKNPHFSLLFQGIQRKNQLNLLENRS